MKDIEYVINNAVNSFVKAVSDKYDIDENDLMSLWNNKQEAKTSITKSNTKTKTNTKTDTKTDSDSDTETNTKPNTKPITETKSGGTCQYIIKKGANEGKECGCKVKDGSTLCYKHKKYEGVEPKQKKVIPTTKKTVLTDSQKNKDIKDKTPSENKIVNNILRKHKTLDKLWHSETGMVFKSAKERVVIGKCVGDKLVSLSADDIKICMDHSFAYENEDNKESVENVVENLQEEKIMNKMARKITDVSSVAVVKKSISTSIKKNTDTSNDLDVEEVLKIIQNDGDCDLFDEIEEIDEEEEEEEFEEEFFGDEDD